MRAHDEVRLRHMIEAAREAVLFAHGRVRVDLDSVRQLLLSLVKSIEIVGEAAAQISESTRSELASIPWPRIVAMRNRLVHAYFSINLDIVWNTVQEDLPALFAKRAVCRHRHNWSGLYPLIPGMTEFNVTESELILGKGI
ncbi:MAG: DUF86 domain-containing protein [Caldilineaceae bacterium SB0664_bin_27]|uniref:DUF86 domain-containing protein n=1 Tax=Caldilineaceae bacterium SB0664_bin_27 TaxID=2605260 RepID=A0A6B0YU82_9CHLR|nr:DUF86 domain-containing protein [Caldilineaceae bacterium SB0664_bin_27]